MRQSVCNENEHYSHRIFKSDRGNGAGRGHLIGTNTAADQPAWDKTFPKSEKVEHRKVSFKNRYGITLSADLYQPKNRNGNWRRSPSVAPLAR